MHFGDPLFSLKHAERHRDYLLNTPNAYTILCGDLCNTAIKSSKSDVYKEINTPDDQWRWIANFFQPVADKGKILGMVTGNHERRIPTESGIDISRLIADKLHVPYRPEGMLIKISFGDGNNRMRGSPYSYFIYFTHGYSGARTASAKAIKAERVANFIHADCVILSHDHTSNAAPIVYLLPDNRTHLNANGWTTGKIKAIRKLLVKSNAYIKFGGYGESLGFSPVDLETPIIYLSGTGKPHIRALI